MLPRRSRILMSTAFVCRLIVVLPYAKAAYVSHVTHHFGSILKICRRDFQS